MNKKRFKIELNKELNDLSFEKIRDLLNEIVEDLPIEYYDYLLCKVKNFKGENYELDSNTLEEYEDLLFDFEEIEDGEICFNCYSRDTGSYYEDGYVYFPSIKLKKFLLRLMI